jgi:alkaline phosphatase isozyme conversion protein
MKRTLPLFLVLAFVLNTCSISTTPTPIATTNAVADTQLPVSTPVINYAVIARAYVKTLTDMGPRVAGTDQEAQAAEAIVDVFKGFGYPTETQPFTETGDNGGTIDSTNVVAVKSGKSAQEIIVGAHYDSADVGLGADDNASGVAVMLEVAELVENVPTPYTIRFIAFGAEEAGLLGSYAYLNQMSQAEFENTVAMINLDSLAAGDIAYVYSDEGQQAALRDWTLEWAFGNGYDLQTIHNVDLSEDDGSGVSDYAAFRDAGIPFVYFEATNWTLGDQDGYTQVDPQYGDKGKIWHTGYDTLEYLDTNFPGRVDQHLGLFVTVLYNILTQYEGSVQ